MTVPPLTWLYAPASRPRLVASALASAAHAVIVDLEDAVLASAKDEARRTAAELLASPQPKPVYVRINGLETPWWGADLEALATTSIEGVVVPKVGTASDVDRLAERVPASHRLRCLLESALAIEHAFEIASHDRVGGISIGEADLRAEIGGGEHGLDWARSRVVFAAVAAGLPRPPQAVYTDIRDLEGLASSCAHGRALGHLGRVAIHPSQLQVIVDAYLPTTAEVDAAQRLLAAAAEHDAGGAGAFVVEGKFVDAAVLRAASVTAALARTYGTRRSR